MAKASVTTRKIPVTIEKEVEEINLVLSRSQAETLGALTGRVGGDPATTRRRHISQIRAALSAAGITFPKAKYRERDSYVYFADETGFDSCQT